MTALTIPAYSEVLGESMSVEAPAEWHDRIRALGAHTVYGENYSRVVVDNLIDMSLACLDGYSAVAYDRLLAAERKVNIR